MSNRMIRFVVLSLPPLAVAVAITVITGAPWLFGVIISVVGLSLFALGYWVFGTYDQQDRK